MLWGWRTRGTPIGDGHFFCPDEGGDRPYRLMLARRWFTVLWVPVVPGKVLGEFVECASCDEPFDRKTLEQLTTSEIEEVLRTALRHAVVAIVRADEKVTNAERKAALAVMTELGHGDYALLDLERDIATLEVHDLEATSAAAGELLTTSGQEKVVRACVELAAADGAVSDQDIDLIATVGRAMGMTPAHIKGVLDEVDTRP